MRASKWINFVRAFLFFMHYVRACNTRVCVRLISCFISMRLCEACTHEEKRLNFVHAFLSALALSLQPALNLILHACMHNFNHILIEQLIAHTHTRTHSLTCLHIMHPIEKLKQNPITEILTIEIKWPHSKFSHFY